MTRWRSAAGGEADVGRRYAARFDALAASGVDVHGEASLCAALVPPGSSVLDAGCGTGRVAIRLAELGYDCVGVDVDAAMLDVARTRAPDLTWVEADLARLELNRSFDLVVCAGNVVPLSAAGSEPAVVARMTAHLAPGGVLVAGFGLDHAHLPPGAACIPLRQYDLWCAGAGLSLVDRRGTWDGAPYTGGGYAVSIHSPAELA